MKTSVIRYRVADFLRAHSPFDVISLEDLLTFAGGGRVVFHEDDIQLFRKGQTREAVFWVVQQGRIEMLDPLPVGDQLRDVLGPGDLIGLRRHVEDVTYQHTARTATEVILYAFELNAFETLVGKYPEAARFLAAHLSAAARHTKALQAPVTRERLLTEQEKSVWLNAKAPSTAWLARRLVTAEPAMPVREAARRMKQAHSEVLAIIGGDRNPLGLLTQEELRDEIATGVRIVNAPVAEVMNRHFLTAPVGRRTADYFLALLRGRTQWLALTENGSPESPLCGVVTEADLEITCGKNPVLLLREMLAAGSVAELAYLWQRAQAFLVESLVGPSVIEWFAQMFSELQAVLVEQLVRIAEDELAQTGYEKPAIAHCWLLFGKAGRRELLGHHAPEIGVVYVDSPPDQADTTASYFSMLAQKVVAALEACNNQVSSTVVAATKPYPLCCTLSAWSAFYRHWIRDPIGSQIYTARECFDFYVVSGEAALGTALQQVILTELDNSDVFIPVLANDTIGNLPPLTFYQGFVLETDGKLNQTLDVQKTALAPVTDAARMLAFAERDVATANTLERLQGLTRALPQFTSILTDAAEAWRIVCYHHTLSELSQPTDAAVIYPARLTRFEQRLLKTAFDSTRRFVELASSIHHFKAS